MTERKELIARLRELSMQYELPFGVEAGIDLAIDALEADAQSIDVAYSQGFIEGERATIVSQAVPQDPVAYSVGNTLHWHDGKGLTNAQLYAAPQQRPRLTDAEIKAIEHETDMKSSIGDWSNYFARAIEAKVRGEA